MIFIGYSSGDRYDIVEPMIFHLKNYGMKVWYDFHDMFLSDDRFHTNFEVGIGKSKYIIFIISHNFFNSKCALEELKYVQALYEKNEIILFPILYKLEASELPDAFNWLRKIIYNEVNEQSGTLFVTNQIIEKILHDKCTLLPLRSFSEIYNVMQKNSLTYLCKLVDTYMYLDIPNYSAKISILYAIYLYISNENEIIQEDYIGKIVDKIVTLTSLNITLDHLSFNIFKLAILIALNKYLL